MTEYTLDDLTRMKLFHLILSLDVSVGVLSFFLKTFFFQITNPKKN